MSQILDTTNEAASINPFDYLNADWIKDDSLRAKVQGESAEKINKAVGVFEHEAYASFAQPLNINQFTASYEGIYGPGTAPTQTTLRSYLKAACKAGKLAKYSRQTYGMPGVTAGQPMQDAPDTGDDE